MRLVLCCLARDVAAGVIAGRNCRADCQSAAVGQGSPLPRLAALYATLGRRVEIMRASSPATSVLLSS
jgi:hypothetical protein